VLIKNKIFKRILVKRRIL